MEFDRQLPHTEEIFLDHVGHFVRDAERARQALIQAGFQPTPISIQRNEDEDGNKNLTGTGNVTAMFRSGYIEALFKTADTNLGQEFDQAMARHEGVHLAAFAVSDACAQSARLKQSGFRTRPIVDLRRPIATETGELEAAFTVARVERGEMAEGRMQFLTHHSEEAVWQKRWLNHPNTADALLDMVIAVDDVGEAAKRFSRFLGHDPLSTAMGESIHLERGGVQLMDRSTYEELLGEEMFGPAAELPFIGVYALRVASLETAENLLARNNLEPKRRENTLLTRFPEGLGLGAWLFVEGENDLPWRRS
ncbi:MAG: VOC family protein [Micropepsaceae bacterium]